MAIQALIYGRFSLNLMTAVNWRCRIQVGSHLLIARTHLIVRNSDSYFEVMSLIAFVSSQNIVVQRFWGKEVWLLWPNSYME